MMIYGAAGYTGGMAAEHAASAGLDLVLAGRARNLVELEALAKRLGAEARIFSLDDPDAIRRGLEGICVLLNGAGPFMTTAEPLMSAAIRAGVHYLEVCRNESAESCSQRYTGKIEPWLLAIVDD